MIAQVPPTHLISASVMSAPAALAMSKLICPETEQSSTTLDDIKNFKVDRYDPQCVSINFDVVY